MPQPQLQPQPPRSADPAGCGAASTADELTRLQALGLALVSPGGPHECLALDTAQLLEAFLSGGPNSAAAADDSVLLPPMPDKNQRRQLYSVVRSHFPTAIAEKFDAQRRLRLRRAPPPKLVCVDLDNTLWPGVLLEMKGVAATVVGGSGGGADCWAPHQLLHTELLRLHALGVLLVSVSRNDETPVLAVWPPAAVCRVQPEHFVCHRFGWTPKSQRIQAVARDVAYPNGLDHRTVVFVDDMPPERAEVEQAMPQLRVLGGGSSGGGGDDGGDGGAAVAAAADIPLAACVLRREADRMAAAGGTTADAASRKEKTRAVLARAAAERQWQEEANEAAVLKVDGDKAEPDAAGAGGASGVGGHVKGADKSRRRAAKAAGAASRVPGTGGGYATTGGYPPAFLQTLDLHLTIQRCDVASDRACLDRVAELAARTTQFNTVLPRPRASMVEILPAVVEEAGGELWTMRAVDRFGDHGVVGVLVLVPEAHRVAQGESVIKC
jgi:hypothetical protein